MSSAILIDTSKHLTLWPPPEPKICVNIIGNTIINSGTYNRIIEQGLLEFTGMVENMVQITMGNWIIESDGKEPAIMITHDMLFILGMPYVWFTKWEERQVDLAKEWDKLTQNHT